MGQSYQAIAQGAAPKAIASTHLEDGTLCFPSQVLGLEIHLLANGWLRFFNPETGEYLRTYREEGERAEREQQRAEREQQRAEREQQRAEREQQEKELERERANRAQERAERLAARLRELGIDPDE